MLAINFHLNTSFFSVFDVFALNYSARNWRISKITINKWDQRLACYLMVYHILFSCRPFLHRSAIFWKLLNSLPRHIMLNNYKETSLSSLFTWSWILLEVLCAIYLFHATHVIITVLVFITEANEGPVWSADSCLESREARSPNEDKAGIFQTWECWCYEVIFHCSGAWFLIVSRVILLLGK